MSGTTCPACGVAVVPGYARCPKCRAPLAASGTRAGPVAGGTSVEDSRFPIIPLVLVGVIAVGIVVLFGVRSDDAPAARVTNRPAAVNPVVAAPSGDPVVEIAPPDPAKPSASVGASELERALRKQRLWSTVQVVGDHVDVRSASCLDAALGPIVDGAAATLKEGGLTRVRCLEQSGRVVFERDL